MALLDNDLFKSEKTQRPVDMDGLGETGAKIMSKIVSLLLASIAVMTVRKGVLAFV